MAVNKGRFTRSEEVFVKQNYLTMSDKQIATALNRTKESIVQYRIRNSLDKNGAKVTKDNTLDNEFKKKAFINNMSEEERKKVFLDDLRSTAQYRTTVKSLTDNEIQFYEERYVEFMMDPTVETMTASEKDTLHRKTITEVRLLRFMEDEKNFRDSGSNQNRAKEIQECQATIHQCEKSLNVTREQRLKDGQDQSINFTNIIKELNDPSKRAEIGYEAAMLKYLAEIHYNSKVGKNILAGDTSTIDVGKNFISNVIPEGYDADFYNEKKKDE